MACETGQGYLVRSRAYNETGGKDVSHFSPPTDLSIASIDELIFAVSPNARCDGFLRSSRLYLAERCSYLDMGGDCKNVMDCWYNEGGRI